MKKRKFSLTIRQAIQKAEGDLRLENALVSELGNGIFSRVKSGETTLRDSKRKIDHYVQTRLAVE